MFCFAIFRAQNHYNSRKSIFRFKKNGNTFNNVHSKKKCYLYTFIVYKDIQDDLRLNLHRTQRFLTLKNILKGTALYLLRSSMVRVTFYDSVTQLLRDKNVNILLTSVFTICIFPDNTYCCVFSSNVHMSLWLLPRLSLSVFFLSDCSTIKVCMCVCLRVCVHMC